MSYGRVFALFGKVFLSQTVRSPKKWMVYPMVLVVFALACLFYEYISAYQHLYIEALKGVYPVFYIQTNGMKVEAPTGDFYHSEEVFEMGKTFKFKFGQNSESRSLVNVGFRSFAPENPLRGKLTAVDPGDTVWFSSRLFKKVAACDGFSGDKIFIDNGFGEDVPLHVKQMTLHGDQDWVLLSNATAEKVGLFKNITTIFPCKQNIQKKQILNIYRTKNIPIFTWKDRLPFFSTVFYAVISTLYIFVISGLALLIFVIGIGLVIDTINEFGRLISFSALYGISKIAVIVLFSSFITAFFSFFYALSWVIKKLINLFVVDKFEFMTDLSSYEIGAGFFFVLVLSINLIIAIYVQKKYSESGLISGQ